MRDGTKKKQRRDGSMERKNQGERGEYEEKEENDRMNRKKMTDLGRNGDAVSLSESVFLRSLGNLKESTAP